MTTVRQPTKRRRSCVLTLKYTFICVYWWTRQRIHNTLIVVNRYLRLMGDKTIPDSAEPRLESFYPPFVAGIDLPHQGVVDSYSLVHPGVRDKRWVSESICLVYPGVWDKRRVSEIDLSQPRHETAFWWRHNGPVTSQLNHPIKWLKYPLELIGIYVHINTHNKEFLTQRCRKSTNVQLCLIFCTYPYALSLNGWHALLCIANKRHGVTITTHAIKRHFLIWMTTMRQPKKRQHSCVFNLKIHLYLCLLVNETKNPQHLDCGRSIPATHGG